MSIAVYPGSFDPVTNGHLHIIERACKIFDKVIITITKNPDKEGTFNLDERVDLIMESIANKPYKDQIEIKTCKELLVVFMKKNNYNIIIKGLRNSKDFEYEMSMSNINKKIDSDIEIIFIVSDPEYNCISSSVVKHLAKYDRYLGSMIPTPIHHIVRNKLKEGTL